MTNGRRDHDLGVFAIAGEELAHVDAVMKSAFDPRYGEAWNSAQILSTLALPGYRMVGVHLPTADLPLAGFAISRRVASESELLLLAVHAAARRRGVGNALMKNWINDCEKSGVERIFLEMREGNDARYLYQSHGFVDVAFRPAYYRGHDGILRNAITMQKILVSEQ